MGSLMDSDRIHLKLVWNKYKQWLGRWDIVSKRFTEIDLSDKTEKLKRSVNFLCSAVPPGTIKGKRMTFLMSNKIKYRKSEQDYFHNFYFFQRNSLFMGGLDCMFRIPSYIT